MLLPFYTLENQRWEVSKCQNMSVNVRTLVFLFPDHTHSTALSHHVGVFRIQSHVYLLNVQTAGQCLPFSCVAPHLYLYGYLFVLFCFNLNFWHTVLFYFLTFLFCIRVQLINNVVLVSDVQQSDSIILIHVSILFQILFLIRLLQNIEQSSLCYAVGPCWLSI